MDPKRICTALIFTRCRIISTNHEDNEYNIIHDSAKKPYAAWLLHTYGRMKTYKHMKTYKTHNHEPCKKVIENSRKNGTKNSTIEISDLFVRTIGLGSQWCYAANQGHHKFGRSTIVGLSGLLCSGGPLCSGSLVSDCVTRYECLDVFKIRPPERKKNTFNRKLDVAIDTANLSDRYIQPAILTCGLAS